MSVNSTTNQNQPIDGANRVYVVHCSNCEPYEDYYSWVESIWASRELAVEHIEKQLKMTKEEQPNPSLRSRWVRHDVTYYTEEDFDLNDDEELLDWQEYQKNPYPAWDEMSDAWIEALGVWGNLDSWQKDYDDKHKAGEEE